MLLSDVEQLTGKKVEVKKVTSTTGRFFASLHDTFISEEKHFIGCIGFGDNSKEAIQALIRLIAGQLLVVNLHGPDRKEIQLSETIRIKEKVQITIAVFRGLVVNVGVNLPEDEWEYKIVDYDKKPDLPDDYNPFKNP